MKTKIWYLFFLLVFAACDNSDGDGASLFYFGAYDGTNANAPIPGATVKVYSSAQAWVNGDTPYKTFTTDSKGLYRSNDVFPTTAVFFTEFGELNNWPEFLTYQPQIQTDGSISVYPSLNHTFLQDFLAISGKTFLISDVLVGDVSIFANLSECSKDNFVTITKENKLIYNEGASVCVDRNQVEEYDISVTYVGQTSEIYMNYDMTWQFSNNWAEASNLMYINKNFNKIMFKAWSEPGQPVIVYTLQN